MRGDQSAVGEPAERRDAGALEREEPIRPSVGADTEHEDVVVPRTRLAAVRPALWVEWLLRVDGDEPGGEEDACARSRGLG
ncbi:MAG TPA: hypothetical protein VFQ80_12665 [Thermomicrobiales bacterium]|nr:hypothetical protein [Thermomicrobiales bacterium]